MKFERNCHALYNKNGNIELCSCCVISESRSVGSTRAIEERTSNKVSRGLLTCTQKRLTPADDGRSAAEKLPWQSRDGNDMARRQKGSTRAIRIVLAVSSLSRRVRRSLARIDRFWSPQAFFLWRFACESLS